MVVFTEDNIIERREYSRISFNTKVEYPENCDVFVSTDGSVKKLKKLDEGIINPKRTHLFSKSIDSRTHIIFFINNSYQDGKWGGNVQYVEAQTNNIMLRKIFIRASFLFNIENGERFIKLLDEKQKNYSKSYVANKVRAMIGNVIKTYFSNSLNEIGYIKTLGNINTISESIMEKLNSNVLYYHGIKICNLNFELEKDNKD